MQIDEYEKMYLFEDFYWWYRGLHRILSSQFKRYIPKGRALNILDAGCGTGKILELLNGYGFITGIDLSQEAVAFAQRRNNKSGRLLQGNISYLPFNDNVFDCVVALDVLDTLENDKEAIREFSRTLKKSSLLIVNLPAYQWLASSHDIAVSRKRRYSRGNAVKIFTESGFKVEKVTYWNTVLFPFEAFIRIINKFLPRKKYRSDLNYLPGSINSLLTGILYLESLLINTLNLPFGLSLLVVARKE